MKNYQLPKEKNEDKNNLSREDYKLLKDSNFTRKIVVNCMN